jgi:hypothetical protein
MSNPGHLRAVGKAPQLGRYDGVIHLRTPAEDHGYNHQNPLRTESAGAAAEIDGRIARAWEQHPRRVIVHPSADFLDKAARAVAILRGELPECCQRHVIPALRGRAAQPPESRAGRPSTESRDAAR